MSSRDAEKEAFRRHYEDDNSEWGKHSGGGSDPFHTIDYRCFLDKFISMNNVKSVVDIGCGDWQFSKYLNFDDIYYTGYDLVPSVIKQNRLKFENQNLKFYEVPENIDDIAGGDLLLMKDVLQHMTFDNIADFQSRVFPKFKHCLLTNSYLKVDTEINTEISPGGFRCLDLALAPVALNGVYVLEFSSRLWERIRTFYHSSYRNTRA